MGEFVRQFKGLSSPSKAKAVTSGLPEIKRLSDFEEYPYLVADLLAGMRHYSNAPSHATFGKLGPEHVRAKFEEFYGELERFDYRQVKGQLPSGLPYVFEFAVALPEEEPFSIRNLFFGVNYSTTFGDPLGDVRVTTKKVSGIGIDEFLKNCHAHPSKETHDDPETPFTAVLAHVITPAPLFMEYGKTRLEIGGVATEMASEIGRAMYACLKDYHKEGRARVRGSRARTPKRDTSSEMALVDAVFKVLPEAVAHVSGNGILPHSARRTYYAVRKLIQRYTSAELDYSYFSQKLLPRYQQQYGIFPLLYYEPRGKLHEPHDGQTTDVGTREVDSYAAPAHLFNKLLYVEKRGQYPLLKVAKLGEKFDMAIMASEGTATTAARDLVSHLDKEQKCQIFVLHDADWSGYNILHTLREETERMPEYSVDVIDIGLTVEQAINRGIQPEDVTRKKALEKRVLKHLTPFSSAWEWFGAERANEKNVKCKRVELDALTAPQVIELIEKRLTQDDIAGKVIPPEDELPILAKQIYGKRMESWATDTLLDLIGWDKIVRDLIAGFEEKYKLGNAPRYIEAKFKQDDTLSWSGALRDVLTSIHPTHATALKDAVRQKVTEVLNEEEEAS